MHILIVAATKHELHHFDTFIEEKNTIPQNLTIEVVTTGVGAVSATYALNRAINKNRPDIMIQAGIAGCFDKNKNNEVFAVRRDVLADIGVYENNSFKNIFDLGLADKNEFPFHDGFLENPYEKLLSVEGSEQVNAITVNEITTNKNRIESYQQKYAPAVESMEGAAFHYVCLQEKIPFMQMRAVSNYIGERDKSMWSIKEAIASLNGHLISLIKKISTYNETYFRI